ncbi:hypothetical protein KUTeg_014150, partial [Tegillarca granosa]
TRRKSKRNGPDKSNDCSSSDSEHSKTLDIINKLSKKYLGSNKKSYKQLTNKDNEYDGDAENTTEGSESSGSTGSIDAYEFDEEDVMDVSPKLSVKNTNKKKQQKRKPDIEKKSSKKQPLKNSDIVNKQKSVESQVCGKNMKQTKKSSPLQTPESQKQISVVLKRLEVDEKDNFKNTRQLRKRSHECTDIKDESLSKDKNSNKDSPDKKIRKKSSPSIKSSSSPSSSTVLGQKSDVNTSISKKDNNKTSLTEHISKGKKKMVTKNTTDDSGIFSTPPVPVTSDAKKRKGKNSAKSLISPPIGKIPLLNAKDTSTPSTEVRSRRKRGNNAFGFGEPVHSILPEISPVQKVDPVTPLSDYASMDTIPSISFDDSSIMKDNSIVKDSQFQLFSMEEDEDFSLNRSSSKTYKVQKKKQPKKKVVQNPKVEKMLVEMNTKFEEIEKFELSIE